MGLLTYAYDPVATASVLARAAESGAQRSQQQQQFLAELAKTIADSRRHSIEFERRQSFDVAKQAEEDRRWNIENSPISPTSPTTPTTSPAASLPSLTPPADDTGAPGALDPSALDIPPAENSGPPAAPDTIASPYVSGPHGLATAGPFDDNGAPVVDPMSARGGETSAPLGPRTLLPPEAVLGADAQPAVDPAAEAAQALADGTTNGPHGRLVPRPAQNVALQTRAGRAATRGLPLDPGALPSKSPAEETASALLDPMTTAQNEMAARGIPRKVATAKLAELATHIALNNMPAKSRPLSQLPDGSIVVGGKQYVKQGDGSYTTPAADKGSQSVEDYQKSKGWGKDTDPASPTFGALVDSDGARHWVHVGGNGKVVDMPAKPPAAKMGFDANAKAKELGFEPKDGLFFDPKTGISYRPGENGFVGVTPRKDPAQKAAPLPTTAEHIWATANANSVERVNVVKPLLDKAKLGLNASYDDMKVAIKAGVMTEPQAAYANYWLGQFRDRVGSKAQDAAGKTADLNKAFANDTAKLAVLKAKGISVQPIDPKELRDAMLTEGATSPDAKARAAAVDALDKQGDMVAVVSPDGAKGKIPRAKLDDALKAGYKAQ